MDGARFDTVTRSLTAAGSRRRALVSAFGGAFGLALGATLVDEAGARNKKKKPCPPCKKRKKGKCKKKKPNGTPCPGGTCDGGRCATCSDGVKNGSETGIDCGGSCPRCGIGQGCTSRNDCASALCSDGTCQTCPGDVNNCGSDADGACICRGTDPPTANVCVKDDGMITACPGTPCSAGEVCIKNIGFNTCNKPCGAP